jgi:hypothetical protein
MLLSTQDKHRAGPLVAKLHHLTYLVHACRCSSLSFRLFILFSGYSSNGNIPAVGSTSH